MVSGSEFQGNLKIHFSIVALKNTLIQAFLHCINRLSSTEIGFQNQLNKTDENE